MSGLPYEFTEKDVSPWGGLRYIEEVYRKSGLKDFVENECPDLPVPGSNQGYSSIDLIQDFIVSVILGVKRLAHSGTLRYDKVIQRIFDWQRGMASQSTFSRFFKKFDRDLNDKIFPAINRFWFDQIKLDKFTVDFDSTVLVRHGMQEGIEVGYNPKKPGRRSHHPLMAFAAELKMVANAWIRTGDGVASSEFEEFFDELLTIIQKERIGLVRADSEFYGNDMLSQFEDNQTNYIIAAKMNRGLVQRIFEQRAWFLQDDGYWTSSFYHKTHGWAAPRRIVVVRKDAWKHSKTGGKLLFPDFEEFERYKYAAFVTNMDLSAEMIWHLYNKRADCENRIHELRNDYGIDGFCMDDFYATEAAFRWTMVAHNLMSLFRLQVLNHKRHPVLSTMKFQCIAIGSYLVKSGRRTVLKLSAKDKRKQFLEGLFQKLDDLSPPFQISNTKIGITQKSISYLLLKTEYYKQQSKRIELTDEKNKKGLIIFVCVLSSSLQNFNVKSQVTVAELPSITIYDEGNLLKLSIEDAKKYYGYICPCLIIGFRAIQLAFRELWEDTIPKREDFKIISKYPGHGLQDAFEYIIRLKSRNDFNNKLMNWNIDKIFEFETGKYYEQK